MISVAGTYSSTFKISEMELEPGCRPPPAVTMMLTSTADSLTLQVVFICRASDDFWGFLFCRGSGDFWGRLGHRPYLPRSGDFWGRFLSVAQRRFWGPYLPWQSRWNSGHRELLAPDPGGDTADCTRNWLRAVLTEPNLLTA